MKTSMKLALAALLASAATGLAPTAPASAQKQPKVEKPKYSPAFLKAAQPAQTAVAADAVAAEPLVAAAEAAATTEDDKFQVGLMRLTVEQAKLKATPGGDQQRLRAPLEALVGNPKLPQAQRATFALVLGQLALQRKDNAAAVPYLTQAQQLGSTDTALPTLLRQARLASGDTAGAMASLESQIAAAEARGEKAPELDYRVAVDTYQKSKQVPQAATALRRWVAAYPTSKNWHDALYIFGLQRGSLVTLDRGQTLDVLRLMRQTKSLDRYAYVEYAQKVIDTGLPDEGLAVLREGRASGTMPADPTVNALMEQAQRQAQLGGSLAPLEARAQTAANGSLAFQTADAYLSQNNYAKAAGLYRVALQKGGVDANLVNMHLGIALAKSGDKEGARAAFNAVTGSPRGDIAKFWVLSLDHPVSG